MGANGVFLRESAFGIPGARGILEVEAMDISKMRAGVDVPARRVRVQ